MLLADLQSYCDSSDLYRELGVRLLSGDKELVLEADIRPRWQDGGEGAPIHGGLLAMIVDTASTFALMVATGDDWSTVDLRLDYLRPVRSRRLRVRAEPIHTGRLIGRVTSWLEDEGGTLAVVGTGTFRRGHRWQIGTGEEAGRET